MHRLRSRCYQFYFDEGGWTLLESYIFSIVWFVSGFWIAIPSYGHKDFLNALIIAIPLIVVGFAISVGSTIVAVHETRREAAKNADEPAN